MHIFSLCAGQLPRDDDNLISVVSVLVVVNVVVVVFNHMMTVMWLVMVDFVVWSVEVDGNDFLDWRWDFLDNWEFHFLVHWVRLVDWHFHFIRNWLLDGVWYFFNDFIWL